MAKVFAIWHGGRSYAYDENRVEVFPSIEAVKQALQERRNGWSHAELLDGTVEAVRTPVVDESSYFQVWKATDGDTKPETGTFVFFGPRGGVKVESGVTLHMV